jgi:hypothetical protein
MPFKKFVEVKLQIWSKIGHKVHYLTEIHSFKENNNENFDKK